MSVTLETFADALQAIDGPVWLDCETTGLIAHKSAQGPADEVCGLAIRCKGVSRYFPVRHAGGKNIEPGQYAQLIARLNDISDISNHNTKFDIGMLAKDGLLQPKRTTCTLIGSHLYNENEPHSLKGLAAKYIDPSSRDRETALLDYLAQNGLRKNEMWRLPPDKVAPYACMDTELAEKLDEFLRKNLYKVSLYEELSNFSRILGGMETLGVQVSKEVLNERRNEAARESRRALEVCQSLAGFPINPKSPAQVIGWLRTPDSTEETLLKLNSLGAQAVLEHRAWQKGVDTYYNKYEEMIDPQDVLHCNFNPAGTVTGRISCSKPNLMAVPRFDPKQKVKDVFVPREGYTLAEVDYSQAEVRVATHYIKEPALIEIFQKGLDTHTVVAKQLGVPRQVGKTLNLSIIYGIGAFALSGKLGCTKSIAEGYLAKYHSQYPGFRRVAKECERVADSKGYIQMLSGRRRHFNCREAETRTAFSGLVQGGSGEIVRRAMARIDAEIPHTDCRMLIQVHDSLVMEIRKGVKKETLAKVKEIMEYQPWCIVPIRVDVKTGPSWGQMEKYEANKA